MSVVSSGGAGAPQLAGRREQQRRPMLPGGASVPFCARLNMKRLPLAAITDSATMVLAFLFALPWTWSQAAHPPLSAHLHLLALSGSSAACLLWRSWSGSGPHSSYVACLDVVSVLLRLASSTAVSSSGAMAVIPSQGTSAAMSGDDLAEPAAAAAAAAAAVAADGAVPGALAITSHAMQIVLASSSMCMCLQLLRPMRLSLSIPTQFLLLLRCTRQSSRLCVCGPLAQPQAQRFTHNMYLWLTALPHLTPLPLSVGLQPDAASECVTVLRFCQVCLGLLAPLAWQAVREARLFRLHQEQRWQARLPPEQGLSAWLYRTIDELSDDAIRPCIVLFIAVLVGSCFDWASVLSTPFVPQ